MLLAVRSGAFNPDRTRSGTMAGHGEVPLLGTPAPFANGSKVAGFSTKGAMSSHSGDAALDDVAQSSLLFGAAEPVQDPSGDSESHASSAETALSETTEESSAQSTSSQDDCVDEQADQNLEEIEPASGYYVNASPLVTHCEKADGILKCGRKIPPTYTKVHHLHGIRCSRCFDL